MRMYLERAQAHNAFMSEEIAEFEMGRRHLANIMGLDPENITQDDIDKAIEYLLPSGLFVKKARPMLKHPLEILPKQKAAQFGLDGRPYSSFFYTGKPTYVECLHNLSLKLVELKKYEGDRITLGVKFDQSQQLKLTGSQWYDHNTMEDKFSEKLSEQEYNVLISTLEHLSKLPYSYMERVLIFQYRLDLKRQNLMLNLEKKAVQYDAKGKGFHEDEGKRKTAMAKVRLYEKGTGIVTVNGRPFLDFFPRLADREQVLFPLQLTDKLCKVDIEATVEHGGTSGQAGAIRLALSKCLIQMVPSGMVEKLRLAGLLTHDPRRLERQKPGQQGARRKYTWEKR
ncbi:hypothetical protein HELRODRAFT_154121 [Helobdella robusta]|uniref:Small ribosomal subunit protein uS9m n=1 Tax=Helobdella robusta TaxID=6412 RepID=T1ELD8_HELRO|nr:hypothetical protein HELRODRAFT_154121 [Helobdella robusta]ESO02460.1 hypothetical protein HELRODRAFT_154121 [Helobdella robusta]